MEFPLYIVTILTYMEGKDRSNFVSRVKICSKIFVNAVATEYVLNSYLNSYFVTENTFQLT